MVPGIQVDDNTLFRKKAVKNGIFMGAMPWTLRTVALYTNSTEFNTLFCLHLLLYPTLCYSNSGTGNIRYLSFIHYFKSTPRCVIGPKMRLREDPESYMARFVKTWYRI